MGKFVKTFRNYIFESSQEKSLIDQYETEMVSYDKIKVGDVIIVEVTDNSGKKSEHLEQRKSDDNHNGRHIVFEEVWGKPGDWKGKGKTWRTSEYEWDKNSHKLIARVK